MGAYLDVKLPAREGPLDQVIVSWQAVDRSSWTDSTRRIAGPSVVLVPFLHV
jgi:hypothetical protein